MNKPNDESGWGSEDSAVIPVILLVEDEAEYRQLIAAEVQPLQRRELPDLRR